jgi:hypothetical protein
MALTLIRGLGVLAAISLSVAGCGSHRDNDICEQEWTSLRKLGVAGTMSHAQFFENCQKWRFGVICRDRSLAFGNDMRLCTRRGGIAYDFQFPGPL